MHNGKDDVSTYQSRPNFLRDGENLIEVANSTFLPSIELVPIPGGDPLQMNSIF
jgi:hypothetical protein